MVGATRFNIQQDRKCGYLTLRRVRVFTSWTVLRWSYHLIYCFYTSWFCCCCYCCCCSELYRCCRMLLLRVLLEHIHWSALIFVRLQFTRPVLELVRNLAAHGDARDGKWRGNRRMEWVASTLTPPPNVVYPALFKLMRTPRLPAVDWTDTPTDLNGLVRFRERRNLVSARVPSRSARDIPQIFSVSKSFGARAPTHTHTHTHTHTQYSCTVPSCINHQSISRILCSCL